MRRSVLAVVCACALTAGCRKAETTVERVLSGAPIADFERWHPAEVIAAFRSAGLEVGDIVQLEPSSQGLAPITEKEGIRFLIPSIGADAGGRIFSFRNEADLAAKRAYYEGLNRRGSMTFSWIFVRENILVQINGTLPQERARRYEAAIQAMP